MVHWDLARGLSFLVAVDKSYTVPFAESRAQALTVNFLVRFRPSPMHRFSSSMLDVVVQADHVFAPHSSRLGDIRKSDTCIFNIRVELRRVQVRTIGWSDDATGKSG